VGPDVRAVPAGDGVAARANVAEVPSPGPIRVVPAGVAEVPAGGGIAVTVSVLVGVAALMRSAGVAVGAAGVDETMVVTDGSVVAVVAGRAPSAAVMTAVAVTVTGDPARRADPAVMTVVALTVAVAVVAETATCAVVAVGERVSIVEMTGVASATGLASAVEVGVIAMLVERVAEVMVTVAVGGVAAAGKASRTPGQTPRWAAVSAANTSRSAIARRVAVRRAAMRVSSAAYPGFSVSAVAAAMLAPGTLE
jgi:hypothetical protein